MEVRRTTLDGMGVRVRPRTYSYDVAQDSRRRSLEGVIKPIAKKQENPATEPIINEEVMQSAGRIVGIGGVATANHRIERPKSILKKPVQEPSVANVSVDQLVAQIQGPVHLQQEPRQNTVKQFLETHFGTKRSFALSAISILLMAGGTAALVQSVISGRAVDDQIKVLNEVASASIDNESLSSDEGMPAEDPIPDQVINSYVSPPDEPRYIDIPKLKNKKTRVLKMGLDQKNTIKTPRNTWDTGWFEGSSKPGDAIGASLIVGHVSGLTNGGVFYNLYRLEEGDKINVEMGDGTILTYTVVAKEEVPLEEIDMDRYLVSKNIDKPGLSLMTCAGEFNPATQTYENRLAVFAVRDI